MPSPLNQSLSLRACHVLHIAGVSVTTTDCRSLLRESRMHRVLQSHLENFRQQFGIQAPADKTFEAFVAFCLAHQHCAERFEPMDQVYEGDDPGIDSIMFIADDTLLSSEEELSEFLARRRRDVSMLLIFTQAKTSETWVKQQLNAFETAVLDFLSEHQRYPHSEFLKERRRMLDIVIANVGKIRHGKPVVACYFASSAREPDAREVLAAFAAFTDRLNHEGLFHTVNVEPIDRDRLINLWIKSFGSEDATLRVLASASFPKSPGIEESYVVTASAKEFVERVLCDENGNLRRSIFDENVRDFTGLNNQVNAEIEKTIKSDISRSRFGILNNGITIISPDVRLQATEIFMSDFQIVNGCQTSNVLYENRESVTDDTTIMAKIIETSDPTIIDEIVRSTNKQTKVEEYQFLATMDSLKAIESYFVARGADEEHRVYFERRPHQFAGQDLATVRIFDIRELARCAGAMFFDKPDLATRYPGQLTSELRDEVFKPENQEEIFYCAAYSYYRLKLHLSNNRISQRYSKIKWYLLMVAKYAICGADVPSVTSSKITTVCEKIASFMSRNDSEAMDVWRRISDAFEPVDDLTRDRLKGSRLVAEMRSKILEMAPAV